MTFPTDQEHYDAVTAALAAVDARPYDYDATVPSSLSAYNLVAVSDRFGGVPRTTGQIGTRSVRVSVRSVGKDAANVREMRRRVDLALREKRISVAGHVSTLIAFESADAPARDGDQLVAGKWVTALASFTYTV